MRLSLDVGGRPILSGHSPPFSPNMFEAASSAWAAGATAAPVVPMAAGHGRKYPRPPAADRLNRIPQPTSDPQAALAPCQASISENV